MKDGTTNVLIVGVGGQGIVLASDILSLAALHAGRDVKKSEIHGMSQRGGDVQSHLRISDKEIASDLIPHGGADMIIGVEPMESLRYLPMLSHDGWLITNTTPFINIPNYPEMDALMKEINSLPKHIALDADAIAHEIKSPRSANIVVLGAASPFLDIELAKLENAIKLLFGRKGDDIVKLNIVALHAGREFAEKNAAV
jgi:indolepyruvate ferredoxin oxidoreductase beta subunit